MSRGIYHPYLELCPLPGPSLPPPSQQPSCQARVRRGGKGLDCGYRFAYTVKPQEPPAQPVGPSEPNTWTDPEVGSRGSGNPHHPFPPSLPYHVCKGHLVSIKAEKQLGRNASPPLCCQRRITSLGICLLPHLVWIKSPPTHTWLLARGKVTLSRPNKWEKPLVSA